MNPTFREHLYERGVEIDYRVPHWWDQSWTADHEIAFLEDYAHKRPDNALRYCELILAYGRIWDSTVDVPKLMLHVARVRDRLIRREAVQIRLVPANPRGPVIEMVS